MANPEERFRFNGKFFFGQTSEMGQILLETVLLLKISNLQLNYKLFWCFDAFSMEIDKNLLFKLLKVTISERSYELPRKLYFLNKLVKRQILRKGFGLMKMILFAQTSERDKYYRKQFCSSK